MSEFSSSQLKQDKFSRVLSNSLSFKNSGSQNHYILNPNSDKNYIDSFMYCKIRSH